MRKEKKEESCEEASNHLFTHESAAAARKSQLEQSSYM